MEAAGCQREDLARPPADPHSHVAGEREHDEPGVHQRGVHRDLALVEIEHAHDIEPQVEDSALLVRQRRLDPPEDHQAEGRWELQHQRHGHLDDRVRPPADLHHRAEDVASLDGREDRL